MSDMYKNNIMLLALETNKHITKHKLYRCVQQVLPKTGTVTIRDNESKLVNLDVSLFREATQEYMICRLLTADTLEFKPEKDLEDSVTWLELKDNVKLMWSCPHCACSVLQESVENVSVISRIHSIPVLDMDEYDLKPKPNIDYDTAHDVYMSCGGCGARWDNMEEAIESFLQGR